MSHQLASGDRVVVILERQRVVGDQVVVVLGELLEVLLDQLVRCLDFIDVFCHVCLSVVSWPGA